MFEFVEITGYQDSALSYHLKTLKEMDLIKSFERGNFMVYSLTDKGQIIHDFIQKSRELNGEIGCRPRPVTASGAGRGQA